MSHGVSGGAFCPSRVLIVLLIALIGGVASVPASATGSPIAGSDTSSLTGAASFGYGKPNQSRIWYNSHRSRWDALLPRDDGGGQGSDHYIVTDVTGSPQFTSVELEDRNDARPDAFWDDAGRTLHVLSSHATQPRFWEVTYDDVTDVYSVNPQVDAVVVPGLGHDGLEGENRPSAVHRSPNGRLWAAVIESDTLKVQQSQDGGATWANAPVILQGTMLTGVTTWTQFEVAGATRVGLFAGENGTAGMTDTYFYYWSIDQDSDAFDVASWTDESGAIPFPVGTETSDDHVSGGVDADQNQYFAVKTESGGPTDPRILLFRRDPAGAWSRFTITEAQESPEQSRPSLVVDVETRQLSVYMNRTGGGDGVRVRAPLDSLHLLSGVPFVTVFSSAGTAFNNVITPRQGVDRSSGIAITANDETHRDVWSDLDPLTEPAPGDVVIAGFQSWNDVGNGPAEFVTLFNTTAQTIDLEQVELVSRLDVDGNGTLDVDWRLSDEVPDLSGASIAPHGFFLIAESGVPAPGGNFHDLAVDLDLSTSRGGATERAASLELLIGGTHMDFVVYGRHDGADSGVDPPGDQYFDGLSYPRSEVIRNTQGTPAFEEGVIRRLSGPALYAGFAVDGYYTDEPALGQGFPTGVWTSAHDEDFGAYEARNSLSPPVPPACAVDTDGDGQDDCLDEDDDGDGVDDVADCAPLDPSAAVLPGDLAGLRVQKIDAAGITWTWDDPGPGHRFDVVGGSLGALRAQGTVAGATCLVDDATDDSYLDASPPPAAGSGVFSLVRAQNACGSGTYGTSAGGTPRLPTADCP